jgi:hypothetical protein
MERGRDPWYWGSVVMAWQALNAGLEFVFYLQGVQEGD